MARILFSQANRADADQTALSGGSWASAHPLDNLQNPRLCKQARSASTATSDTILDVDLGQERDIRLVALVGHNLSLAARIKIQLRSATAGGGDLLAGHADWTDAWPAMYAGSPDRKPTTDELDALPRLCLLVLNEATSARYLRIELDDTGNSDGYLALGRLWVGDGWQPARNFAYGAELSVLDETPVEESPAGAQYAGTIKKRRTARLSLDWLSTDEGYQQALDMSARLGKTGQLLVCLDPDQGLNRLRQTLLCTMEADTLSLPQYGITSMSFEFKEVVA